MEATLEQSQQGLAICQVLATVLERLVQANTHLARADPGQVTRFHAMKAPGIAIQQYLERIHKYASCSNECFILALIYIDGLIQRSNFLLTELNVHRVVITSILLAAKFFDDAYYNNAYYAKVGGVLVSEMNGLEVDFLFRINFSLHVAPQVFDKYRAELMVHSGTIQEQQTMQLVYSPLNMPLQSDMSATQAQITPSPPPPDYTHYDFAANNHYNGLQHASRPSDVVYVPVDISLLNQTGGQLQQQQQQQQQGVKLTPTYYPQQQHRRSHVVPVENPFYNPQQQQQALNQLYNAHHHHHHHQSSTSDSSWGCNTMLGVPSGAGM